MDNSQCQLSVTLTYVLVKYPSYCGCHYDKNRPEQTLTFCKIQSRYSFMVFEISRAKLGVVTYTESTSICVFV